MTQEQKEIITQALALLQQAKDIEEITGWAKTRIKTEDANTRAALDNFNNREQQACTRAFAGLLDKLIMTIIQV